MVRALSSRSVMIWPPGGACGDHPMARAPTRPARRCGTGLALHAGEDHAPGTVDVPEMEVRMASHDALVLTPHGAALEQQRDTIVLVRWALILTCAYLMLLAKDTAGPMWLAPALIAAFLGSNLIVGRMARTAFAHQSFKIAVAVMDTCFIAASLWVAQQLSIELLLLCLGVLVMAIAGLRLVTIAAVAVVMSAISVAVGWLGGADIVWQSSVLLRVPFLLGAALVFAVLVQGQGTRRAPAPAVTADDLLETITTHVARQQEAIRRYSTAMADGATATARDAMEDIVLHNRQMDQKLARWVPEVAARNAA
jgi:hypothetical protein